MPLLTKRPQDGRTADGRSQAHRLCFCPDVLLLAGRHHDLTRASQPIEVYMSTTGYTARALRLQDRGKHQRSTAALANNMRIARCACQQLSPEICRPPRCNPAAFGELQITSSMSQAHLSCTYTSDKQTAFDKRAAKGAANLTPVVLHCR